MSNLTDFCTRCNGLFIVTLCYDEGERREMLRCVNCGNMVDNKVYEHRMIQSLEGNHKDLLSLLRKRRAPNSREFSTPISLS